MKRIAIIGPPGAGKTTLSRALAAEFGVPLLSTGQMLREARAAGELPPDAAARYDRGELMPGGLVEAMLIQRLQSADGGWVIDGYPRSLPEAELLVGGPLPRPHAVIVLSLSAELAAARITRRGYCVAHGDVVADEGGQCPHCGGRLARRREDDPAILARRRAEYDEHATAIVRGLGDLVIELGAERESGELIRAVRAVL